MTQPGRQTNVHSRPTELCKGKIEFNIRRAAFLPVEGVGVNGTFLARGWLVARGSNLFVTAMGYTAAMASLEHRKAIQFYGRAELIEDGVRTVTRQLIRSDSELWPSDEYTPIGAAAFSLPARALQPRTISIKIEVSYTYTSASGAAVPVPQFGRATVNLNEGVQTCG